MIFSHRRAFLALAFCSVFVGVARAQDDSAISKPLEALYGGLEAVMKAGKATPFTQRFETLAPVVEAAFDLSTILKVSVGLRWDSMDGQTRDALLRAFQRFTVATYVASFDKYDGERFEVLPGARESGTDRVVRTEIVPTTGDRIRLDYDMRNENGQWRAGDVLIDGSISRVAVQRSDFRSVLESGGGDALLASLQRKTSDLSGGAMA